MKKILAAIYIALLLVMAVATIVEKYQGTDFVSTNIYGSWWFCLLWAFGLATGIFYFIKRKAHKRLFVLVLHFSFVIILAGALLTHLTAKRGSIFLPKGQVVTKYADNDGMGHDLGFTMRLDRFDVTYHTGTEAPEDYISTITINGQEQVKVSMNKIYQHGTIRLYQANYSPDLLSSTLIINTDPYGIPVTYTGYALLFISLVWMLFAKNSRYRQVLRNIRKASLVVVLFASSLSLHAQHVLSPDCAKEFGKMYIVYNDRVCPMETFAMDFTKKLNGKATYKGFSATQVLTGFMFWSDDWMNEPILKIKRGPLRSKFNFDGHIAPSSLFGMGGYVLGPYLMEETNDKFHNEVYDIDDVLMLIMQVEQMNVLKVFPYTEKSGKVEWFSPSDSLPTSIQREQQLYIHNIMPMAAAMAQQGNEKAVKEIFHKMRIYQHRYGETSLPSKSQVWAEGIYNHMPFATILFMLNLTVAILAVVFMLRKKTPRFVQPTAYTILALSFLALTFGLILRWIVSGTIPMNNGYETTLVIAWVIMIVALLTTRYMKLMTVFGLLMSGFMLLVSHINQMNPAITHRMPVLNSPLLSIHVSIIMMAYALLSLTFIIGVWAFIQKREQEHLQNLSLLFLYPSILCLGIGIFVGAIWANVSWGTYWSWDSKEVWALITFMVYAVPLHEASLPSLRKPSVYHLYMLFAFLTVLMTYFGVNYFLSGMHSYA